MWLITNILFNDVPIQQIRFSDDKPINIQRGSQGTSSRVFFGDIGFLDITELGYMGLSGNDLAALDINGKTLYYHKALLCTTLVINVSRRNKITVSNGVYSITTVLFNYPVISSSDINRIKEMEKREFIPYRENVNTEQTPTQRKKNLQTLAKQYFPFVTHGYVLALSIYDWMTIDFFRMSIFNMYCYTGIKGKPRYLPDIANSVANYDADNYKITNADFMNSFMLEPMLDVHQILNGLMSIEDQLVDYLNALSRVTMAAKYLLPRTPIKQAPLLYSGQVAIRNLSNDAIVAYFLECPLNNGPVATSISMPIELALTSFMAPGKSVTPKTFINFTALESEAVEHSQGVLFVLKPKTGAHVWGEGITNIAPLSNSPKAMSAYTISPGTRLCITGYNEQVMYGKALLVIHMTCADTVVAM